MARTVEIILGYVEAPVAVGAGSTSILDQYNSDKSGYALVNQSAQTGAAVAGVTQIVKLTAGFTPFLNIKTNTLAATTVLLKITAEYQTNQKFEEGDVLSLIGNIAGIVGGITLLAGAGPTALVFTAVGVGANAWGVFNSDVAKKLYHSAIIPVLEKYFVADTKAVFPDYWVAPDLTLASLDQIIASYSGGIAVSQWNPDTHDVSLGSNSIYMYGVDSGSGGGYIEGDSGGSQVIPLPVSGWGIGVGPIEFPEWNIDIGPIQIIEPGGSNWGVDRYH
ncbi:hypothetical protein HP546_15685 [Pseudomonas sp. CM25]|uniref:hypothetical protein n=1 Tax=Pseudomonas sp. CM25 TaxID=2738448 RepID=UPI001554ABFA|nr:hypothetical protein [Pseudomonas sp. CM25]NQD56786.1 hypothetical protein [Pseudomonas sp. CM25]